MKFPEDTKKQAIIFALLLLILFGIIYVIDTITKKESPNNTTPTQSTIQEKTEPTKAAIENDKLASFGKDQLIPTYPPEEGSGVNLEAPVVASSIQEIQKLSPYLPYINTFKTTTNKEVSIVIPDIVSQTNTWTLLINIFDIDYRSTKGDPDYILMKNSFNETVLSIYSWIKEKGVDPKKIMIIWGDKEYIQNKAQEWLD